MSIANSFTRIAKWTCHKAGHPATFGLAVLIILVWAVTGPVFHFSDTWQLAINTGTTVVTFLMVFLIQNTQNRDGAAMQIKLDELIRALQGAHNELVDLEDMSDEELEQVKADFTKLAERARAKLQQRPRTPDEDDGDQARTGNSRGLGKAATKASTAAGSS
ncbi:MAG: low affinity iron permease family protein [Gemmatimonadales bacterium]